MPLCSFRALALSPLILTNYLIHLTFTRTTLLSKIPMSSTLFRISAALTVIVIRTITFEIAHDLINTRISKRYRVELLSDNENSGIVKRSRNWARLLYACERFVTRVMSTLPAAAAIRILSPLFRPHDDAEKVSSHTINMLIQLSKTSLLSAAVETTYLALRRQPVCV